MCDCVEKIIELLQENCGDNEAKMNGVSFCIGNNNHIQTFMTGSYSFRKKTITGEFYKTKTSGNVVFAFCPFCGEKYNFIKDVKKE